jgi:hypothetical protein
MEAKVMIWFLVDIDDVTITTDDGFESVIVQAGRLGALFTYGEQNMRFENVLFFLIEERQGQKEYRTCILADENDDTLTVADQDMVNAKMKDTTVVVCAQCDKAFNANQSSIPRQIQDGTLTLPVPLEYMNALNTMKTIVPSHTLQQLTYIFYFAAILPPFTEADTLFRKRYFRFTLDNTEHTANLCIQSVQSLVLTIISTWTRREFDTFLQDVLTQQPFSPPQQPQNTLPLTLLFILNVVVLLLLCLSIFFFFLRRFVNR